MPMRHALALALLLASVGLPAEARSRQSPEPAESLTPVLARAAARSGQWESAARLWRLQTQAMPTDAEAWASLGQALTLVGAPADAIAALARAAELQPGRPGLPLSLGRAQLQQGNATAALAAFGAATSANPRDPAAWTGLGIAHDLLGSHQQAQEAYGRALGIDPLHASARHNLALSRQLAGEPLAEGSRP